MDNKEKKYQQLVEEVTPKHNLPKNMFKAFLVGGIICVIGQLILEVGLMLKLDKDTASAWCSLLLILMSVILTGFNLFGLIAKFGGAGALVPITGFANGVASPAIEYKKDASDIIGTRSKKPRKIKGFR